MKLDTVIGFWLKLIAVKVLDRTSLPASPYWLFSSFTSREDFNVNHVMLLGLEFCVEVGAAIENEITRLHFFKLQNNRQSVDLVCLVPSVELEAELFPQVVDNLSDQSAAV